MSRLAIPDLASYFEALIADCSERASWSPRTWRLQPEELPRRPALPSVAIDWECVHYGNPAFDAAFVLNHLLLEIVLTCRSGRSRLRGISGSASWQAAASQIPEWRPGSKRRRFVTGRDFCSREWMASLRSSIFRIPERKNRIRALRT